jgi:hypothetical protein
VKATSELLGLIGLGVCVVAAAAGLGLGAGGLLLFGWFLLFERRFHANAHASRR